MENIKSFLNQGIADTPLDAKIHLNPDNSISGTMPIKLFLYQGADDDASEDGLYDN